MRLSLLTALKACAKKKDLYQGSKIHADINASGVLEKDPCLGDALVTMYAQCGALVRAQEVFDKLPLRSVVSWTALIAGYVQHGQGQKALRCFHQMQSQGFSPDAFTYASVLKACGIVQNVGLGNQIHDEIVSQGLLNNNVVLGGALVDMYVKCGVLLKAQNAFDALPLCNTVCWNALIAGYAQQGQGQEALGCFQQMRSQGFSPNAVTYACALKACSITQEVDVIKKIHDEIVSQGLLNKNVVLGGALVDVFAKGGALLKAQKVFDSLPVRSVVSWTALISGYAQHGRGQEALACFQRMRSEGFSPDAVTYACVLKACGIVQDIDMGKKLHYEIVNQGLLNNLGGALVDMYAKCGVISKAQEVFDALHVRNAICWNALIAGYAQHGQGREALGCFQQMRSQGFSPTEVTYACVLKACGNVQDVDVGNQIHDEIVSQELLNNNVVLGGALVDMYAKCGVLLKAQKVLDALPVRNAICWNALIAGYVQHGQGQEALGCFQRMQSEGFSPDEVSWNALIGGYAQQGLAKEALGCFQWMQQEGMSPNAITFYNVLNACGRSGLVDEGEKYFDYMRETYGIAPSEGHYACMVVLFGHARLFDKAMRVIRMMPSSEDHPLVWSALLRACKRWGKVKLGRFPFEHAVQTDGCNAAAYTLMSNIYAASGMQEEAENVERMGITNLALAARM